MPFLGFGVPDDDLHYPDARIAEIGLRRRAISCRQVSLIFLTAIFIALAGAAFVAWQFLDEVRKIESSAAREGKRQQAEREKRVKAIAESLKEFESKKGELRQYLTGIGVKWNELSLLDIPQAAIVDLRQDDNGAVFALFQESSTMLGIWEWNSDEAQFRRRGGFDQPASTNQPKLLGDTGPRIMSIRGNTIVVGNFWSTNSWSRHSPDRGESFIKTFDAQELQSECEPGSVISNIALSDLLVESDYITVGYRCAADARLIASVKVEDGTRTVLKMPSDWKAPEIAMSQSGGVIAILRYQNPNGGVQLYDADLSSQRWSPISLNVEPEEVIPTAAGAILLDVDRQLRTVVAHFWDFSTRRVVGRPTELNLDIKNKKLADFLFRPVADREILRIPWRIARLDNQSYGVGRRESDSIDLLVELDQTSPSLVPLDGAPYLPVQGPFAISLQSGKDQLMRFDSAQRKFIAIQRLPVGLDDPSAISAIGSAGNTTILVQSDSSTGSRAISLWQSDGKAGWIRRHAPPVGVFEQTDQVQEIVYAPPGFVFVHALGDDKHKLYLSGSFSPDPTLFEGDDAVPAVPTLERLRKLNESILGSDELSAKHWPAFYQFQQMVIDRISKLEQILSADEALENLGFSATTVIAEATDEEKEERILTASFGALARFLLIGLVLFVTKTLIGLYRYFVRLAAFYEARADGLALSTTGNSDLEARLPEKLSDIFATLAPDTLDLGPTPKTPIAEVADAASKVATAAAGFVRKQVEA